jgi:hypothetical protein
LTVFVVELQIAIHSLSHSGVRQEMRGGEREREPPILKRSLFVSAPKDERRQQQQQQKFDKNWQKIESGAKN